MKFSVEAVDSIKTWKTKSLFYILLTWGVSGIASPRSAKGITAGVTTVVVDAIWMYEHKMRLN